MSWFGITVKYMKNPTATKTTPRATPKKKPSIWSKPPKMERCTMAENRGVKRETKSKASAKTMAKLATINN